MKATIEIELHPFTVPNFVIRKPRARRESEEKDSSSFSYALDELDANTLERMCDDFRDAVFKKAGKQRPPTCKPERAS